MADGDIAETDAEAEAEAAVASGAAAAATAAAADTCVAASAKLFIFQDPMWVGGKQALISSTDWLIHERVDVAIMIDDALKGWLSANCVRTRG